MKIEEFFELQERPLEKSRTYQVFVLLVFVLPVGPTKMMLCWVLLHSWLATMVILLIGNAFMDVCKQNHHWLPSLLQYPPTDEGIMTTMTVAMTMTTVAITMMTAATTMMTAATVATMMMTMTVATTTITRTTTSAALTVAMMTATLPDLVPVLVLLALSGQKKEKSYWC